jgi:hypothetical protein
MSDDTCYMCDRIATSREHVPAQSFFPEAKDAVDGADLRRNLITVPSCETHNQNKKKDDEYIWFLISASPSLNECGHQMVRTTIQRSIERRPALARGLIEKAVFAWVSDGGDWKPTVKAPLQVDRVYSVLEMYGRGLYYHHFKRKWLAAVKAFPHFTSFDNMPARARPEWRRILDISDRAFRESERFGENPAVFHYQVLFDSNDPSSGLIRLTFYEGAAITLAFSQEPMGGPST